MTRSLVSAGLAAGLASVDGCFFFATVFAGRSAIYATSSYALSLSVRPSMIASAIFPTSSLTARIASSLPGNRIVDFVGIAVGVDDGDDRNLELARFEDRDALFLRIDDEDRVGQAVHVFDAAQEALEFVHLVLQLGDFFFGKAVEIALSLHVLELAQARDALLDGREVGQRSAQPALVDEERAGALGLVAHDVLRLFLRADEQNDFPLARQLLDDLDGFAQLLQR